MGQDSSPTRQWLFTNLCDYISHSFSSPYKPLGKNWSFGSHLCLSVLTFSFRPLCCCTLFLLPFKSSTLLV